MQGFDLQCACDALKISEPIYLKIVRKALDQTSADLVELKKAYDANDLASIQSVSHRLKGDYANLRMELLSQIARHLNDLCRTEYRPEQAGVLILELEAAFEQFKTYILNKING